MQWEQFLAQKPSIRWNSLIVIGIILLGCFFRLWKLGSLFDGMTYDEAYKGLDGIAIREFGEHPIFLNWNGGREALVAYLVAGAQSVFDYTIVSDRIVTALAGCVTLVFFYLWTRTVFNQPVALLSTFFLAVSKWHIVHSRYGVRAGLYPAFEVGTLYFLSRGLKSDRKQWGYLIAAGIVGGLGLYTYIAYRIFPFVILAYIAERVVRSNLRKQIQPILAALVISIAIVAPLAKFYLENKGTLTDRMKRTQVWRQQDKEGVGPVRLVLNSAAKTFGLFTYEGDSIARHNMNAEPMLSPFTTAFFLLGSFLTLLNVQKPYAKFLLLYLLFTLVPGILSVGAPNVPRVFGSLPVAILLVSFGVMAAAQIVLKYSSVLATTFLAIVLAGSLLTGFVDSFVRIPSMLDSLSPRLAALWGMDRDQANVARLANQIGSQCDIYMTPQFFFHSTIEYLTYKKSTHKLISQEPDSKKGFTKDQVAIVIFQPNQINPWWLRDDAGKGLFKWWNQFYQTDTATNRRAIRKTYEAPFTKITDLRLIRSIQNKYPGGKEVRFEHFSLYIFKP